MVAAIALAASFLPACSSGEAGSPSGQKSSGGGQGGGDLDIDGGLSGSSGGSIDPDAACAAETFKSGLTPVNMLILFDRSASMAYKSKFPQATAALTAFFQNPASASLRVALRFFPDKSCDSPTCNTAACSPPLVPIGALTAAAAPADAQEQALVSAVAATTPESGEAHGGTPLSAALGGAEQWATAYRAAHPGEQVVVILVSDGEPNGCDMSYATLNKLAASAYAQGVPTYAVGLAGFFQSQMDDIAQNGGTGKAFFIGKQNVETDLLAALQSIQKGQVSCDMPMPKSQKGNEDPTLVNVSYTPSGGKGTLLPYVDSAAACGPGGGFYYDDPNKPTKILLCPATCATVQADPDPTIDILLGCMGTIH